MIFLNPRKWEGRIEFPAIKDPRWIVGGLLFIYVVLGCTVLGFSRKPEQIILLVFGGILLDFLLAGLIRGKYIFPLSALISCLSLSILINFSLGYQFLWIPVFITIASKYLFTLKGKHFFNPSLFGICICLLLGQEYITLAPAYQWYGTAESAWAMGVFVLTTAIFLFALKINRTWLIISFLGFYILQTALRAYVLRNILPPETLFVGTLTSPAFYLFTFYMITDPATSPSKKWDQILQGFLIAAFDLYYHTKFSLFTFFYAGLTVAAIRFIIGHIISFSKSSYPILTDIKHLSSRLAVLGFCCIPFLLTFTFIPSHYNNVQNEDFKLKQIPVTQSGVGWDKSDILIQTDQRVHNVSKWLLSVGDAVATADVNLDGLPDLFLTQTLKSPEWRGKLYLNKGNFEFEKIAIPDLEVYLYNPKQFGLPSFSLFFDYDNDGDKDLFVGFGFGKSHLFENKMIPSGNPDFVEKKIPYLTNNNTMCLSANCLDFNKDGYLDLLIANTLPPYLSDYKEKVPFNIFDLPKSQYDGDRRMFHFMHDSWHNANNGGENHLLINRNGSTFIKADNDLLKLKETRWSLAIGTADFNNDGYTDIYIANDFGKDDCYLNMQGKYFKRQQGNFYGEIGLDTYKGMNVSIGDIEGKYKEDVYISNVHHALQAEGSLLWINYTEDNEQSVNFKERASEKKLLNPNRFGWGAAMVDINLDGWLDVIQANGMVGDDWDKKYENPMNYWYFQEKIARTGPEIHTYSDMWADIRGMSIYEYEPDCIFINHKGEVFEDVSEKVGFTHRANTRGVAAVDLDNDGDLDLIVTDQFGAPIIYENKVSDRNWIGFELIGNGKTCSIDAVGTKIWLQYNIDDQYKQQYREIRLVNGFSAQGDIRVVFGLGINSRYISNLCLKVKWYDGREDLIKNLQMNAYNFIRQNSINNNYTFVANLIKTKTRNDFIDK